MSEKEKEIRRMEKKKAKEQRSSKKKWNLKTTANGGKQELERAASGSRELVEGYQLSNGWAYLKSKIFDSLFPVFFFPSSFLFDSPSNLDEITAACSSWRSLLNKVSDPLSLRPQVFVFSFFYNWTITSHTEKQLIAVRKGGTASRLKIGSKRANSKTFSRNYEIRKTWRAVKVNHEMWVAWKVTEQKGPIPRSRASD